MLFTIDYYGELLSGITPSASSTNEKEIPRIQFALHNNGPC